MGATCGVSVVCAWMVAMWSHPSLAQGEPNFQTFFGVWELWRSWSCCSERCFKRYWRVREHPWFPTKIRVGEAPFCPAISHSIHCIWHIFRYVYRKMNKMLVYIYSHTAIRWSCGIWQLGPFCCRQKHHLAATRGHLLRHLSGLGCVVLFPFLTWPRNQMDPNLRKNHGQLISKWLTTKRLVSHRNVGLDWTPSLHGLSMAKINGGCVAP